jgi:hypothetical protein
VQRWPVQWTSQRAVAEFPADLDTSKAGSAREQLIALVEQQPAGAWFSR